MTATTAKTPKITFTPEEQQLLQREAYAVWDECAYDVLQAVADDKFKGDINRSWVSRAVAMEIALDAGRLEERLRQSRRYRSPLVTDDLLKRVSDADYKTMIAVVKPAFTYARYGM